MLAISTSWNYKADGDVRTMLSEIKETGLNTIELGYRVNHSHLDQFIALLAETGISVSSLHNFCPVPYDTPSPRHPSNYYRLSSLDENERQKAVHWTKNTIDTALRVKAQVVVIHAGTVELADDPTSALFDMYRQGKRNTKDFDDLRERLLSARKEKQNDYVTAVEKSLKDVVTYAETKGIKIGLETRYYPVEIPNYQEVGYLLDRFHKQGLYYWHDVGHAELNDRLGITPHKNFLNSYGDKMIGVHIHGMQVLRDHLAPFTGDFDLSRALPFLNGNIIKVIESHSSATVDQIRQAVKKLS